MINIDHLNKYKCSHLIPTKNIDHTHRGIKNILNMSLILIQNKTITNKNKNKSLRNNITHATTHKHSNRNPITNIHGNQQNIYDINIKHQELGKGMLISNTLKGKLNIHQTMNSLWIVTTIKAILKTPIQKFENTIFSFRRAHEAAVRDKKIIAALKCDLGTAIAEQEYSPVNSGS